MIRSRFWLARLALVLVVTFAVFAGQIRIATAQEHGTSIESAIEVGTIGMVEDYELTVTDVSFDATDEVLAADSFNVAPEAGFQYVLVSMMVTNLVVPDDDISNYGLLFGLVGDSAVGQVPYPNPCGYVGDGETVIRELERGESATVQICWAIAENEVDSVILYVEKILGDVYDPIYFSLGNNGPTFDVPEIDDDTVSDNSRNEPVPVGESGLVGDYLFSVIAVEADATERITNINEFNINPEEGSQYFLVRAQIQYVGDEIGSPWWQLDYTATGESQREYTSYEESCDYVPDSDNDISALFPGGEAIFNLCWMVESNDADSLSVQVIDVLDSNESGVWFSLADD